MYAVVKTGGKQLKVEEGAKIVVERIDAEIGSTVSLPVLLTNDGGKILAGGTELKLVTVTAEVVEHVKADKVIVFKFKKRKGYKRTKGHRQNQTVLQILSISTSGKKAAPAKAEAAEKVAEKPATKAPAKKAPAKKAAAKTAAAAEKAAVAEKPTAKKPAAKPAAAPKPAAKKPATKTAAKPAAPKAPAAKPAAKKPAAKKPAAKAAPKKAPPKESPEK